MRCTVATLALAAAFTPLSAAAPGQTLFPLATRASWTLSDEQGSMLRIRSTRSGSAYTLHGFPGFSSVRVRAARSDVQAWDARTARWRAFLRLSAAAGTRYGVNLSSSPLWRAVEVTVASRAPCRVASRTVRGCVTLELRALRPIADAGIERLVFAPGVGPVAITEQTIAGPRTYTLGGTQRP